MNTLKKVTKDLWTMTTDTAGSLGTLGTTVTGEGVKLTGKFQGMIIATPAVVGAVIGMPRSAVTKYIMDDQGVSRKAAAKIVDDMFPATVADAINTSAEACGTLFAAMAKDDDADVVTVEQLVNSKLTRAQMADMIVANAA